jgi:hypothetical protein
MLSWTVFGRAARYHAVIMTLLELCLEARSGDQDTVRWNWFIYARQARVRLAGLEA